MRALPLEVMRSASTSTSVPPRFRTVTTISPVQPGRSRLGALVDSSSAAGAASVTVNPPGFVAVSPPGLVTTTSYAPSGRPPRSKAARRSKPSTNVTCAARGAIGAVREPDRDTILEAGAADVDCRRPAAAALCGAERVEREVHRVGPQRGRGAGARGLPAADEQVPGAVGRRGEPQPLVAVAGACPVARCLGRKSAEGREQLGLRGGGVVERDSEVVSLVHRDAPVGEAAGSRRQRDAGTDGQRGHRHGDWLLGERGVVALVRLGEVAAGVHARTISW